MGRFGHLDFEHLKIVSDFGLRISDLMKMKGAKLN